MKLKEYKEKALKDEEFKEEYDMCGLEFEGIRHQIAYENWQECEKERNDDIKRIRKRHDTLRDRKHLTEFEKGIVRGLHIALLVLEKEEL